MIDPILILQNGDDCPPGPLGEEIIAAGLQYELCEVFAGHPLPSDVREYSAVITLGGSISVRDDHHHPVIEAQMQLLRAHIAGGKPTLGICLGFQILARTLGACVSESSAPECFFTALEPGPSGEEDAVLGPIEEWPRVLSWHFDTSDLPEGARLLARSDACEVQVFRIGAGQYAFQFHPEATQPMIESWIDRFEAENGADARMDRVREEIERYLPAAEQFGRRLFRRWLAIVRCMK